MTEDADRFEQPQRAERVGIGGIFRRLEADLHMALRGEIVDLVGLDLLDDADQVGGVGHVAVMQMEAAPALVRVLVEMIDALGVEGRRPALDAVDDNPWRAAIRRVGAVLPVTPVIRATLPVD